MTLPNQNHLPKALNEVVNGASELERMDPGESTWTVPWAMANTDGEIKINQDFIERNSRHGGTAILKVFKDFDGVVIDATALDTDAVKSYLKQTDTLGAGVVGFKRESLAEVKLVLFPRIEGSADLNPEAVQEYNESQTAIIKQFRDHHRETYGTEYALASSGQDLGRSAVSNLVPTDAPRRRRFSK